MHKIDYHIPPDLAPYVNCIMIGKDEDPSAQMHLPIYADGYPGIMFQQANAPFYLLPRKKQLSQLFLYGQTIDPIALEVKGPYQYIVIQLYPFASQYLLEVDPKVLNDDCYDLLSIPQIATFQPALLEEEQLLAKIPLLYQLMQQLIQQPPPQQDPIQKIIKTIIQKQGRVVIKELIQQVYMSGRSFERNFKAQVGLTPKQFAKIIQFQSTLQQIDQASFEKLTDVGMEHGFSDQSHFIRVFKSYTGQTPSFYLRHQA